MRNEQPLTPLEFVELGRRITEEQAEKLEIHHLIHDARLIVSSVYQTVQSALGQIGAEKRIRAVRKALLGQSRRRQFSYARKPPESDGGRPRATADYRVPEPLTVVDGQQGKRRWKAVVVQDRHEFPRIMVLGYEPRDVIYRNWSRAVKPVLGYSTPRYWNLGNPQRIDPNDSVI